ncbi:hypothetical protein MKX03_018311 [Papaver bracteatum]|nr:hypothetical protein MKX03_018311 [Papaver bracteatum]
MEYEDQMTESEEGCKTPPIRDENQIRLNLKCPPPPPKKNKPQGAKTEAPKNGYYQPLCYTTTLIINGETSYCCCEMDICLSNSKSSSLLLSKVFICLYIDHKITSSKNKIEPINEYILFIFLSNFAG